MEEKLRKRFRKYCIFCLAAGVILACSNVSIFERFSDARVYFGEKPYMYGVNQSVLFSDITMWVSYAGGGIGGIGFICLCLDRKKTWHLSEARNVAWICTIGGLIFLLYGGYKMLRYHGRELYCDIYPILNSASKPYIVDTFLYVPLVLVAAVILWGMLLLWRLYHINIKL